MTRGGIPALEEIGIPTYDAAFGADGAIERHGHVIRADSGRQAPGGTHRLHCQQIHGEHGDPGESLVGQLRGVALVGQEKLGALQGSEEFLFAVLALGEEIAPGRIQTLVDGPGGFEIHFIQGGKKTIVVGCRHRVDACRRGVELARSGAHSAPADLLGIG